MRALRLDACLDDPRGHHVRMRGLRPSDKPDVGHAAGEDEEAAEDVVPRHLRDLDAAHRQSTTQYVGRVAFALVVVDARTGTRLLTRRYVGLKRRQAGSDEESTWREVMDAALARTIHDVATDPELVAALARR